MKQLPVVLALMIVAAIAAITPANQAQADSRVIVGVDLGGVVAAFESRPRYIYSRPVVYERRHTWRSLPPPPSGLSATTVASPGLPLHRGIMCTMAGGIIPRSIDGMTTGAKTAALSSARQRGLSRPHAFGTA